MIFIYEVELICIFIYNFSSHESLVIKSSFDAIAYCYRDSNGSEKWSLHQIKYVVESIDFKQAIAIPLRADVTKKTKLKEYEIN